jgi:hypothetical protein
MTRMRIAVVAVAFFAQLGLAGLAQAGFEVTTYNGSRDDLRAYCVGEGRTLIEHPDYSLCQDEMTGANHGCEANGDCFSAGNSARRLPGNSQHWSELATGSIVETQEDHLPSVGLSHPLGPAGRR